MCSVRPANRLLYRSNSAIFKRAVPPSITRLSEELMLNRRRQKEIIIAVAIIVGLLVIMALISRIA